MSREVRINSVELRREFGREQRQIKDEDEAWRLKRESIDINSWIESPDRFVYIVNTMISRKL